MVAKFKSRNRQMYDAFLAGIGCEALALEHGLTKARVSSILTQEKNRVAVSPDPYYRNRRDASRGGGAEAG